MNEKLNFARLVRRWMSNWDKSERRQQIDISLTWTNGLTNDISLMVAEKAENFDWLRINILSHFQISTASPFLIHLLIYWFKSNSYIYQLVFFVLFSQTCHFIFSVHRTQNNKTLSQDLKLNDNDVSHKRTMSLATSTMETLHSIFDDSVAGTLDNMDRCLMDEWMDGSTCTLEELISFADYPKRMKLFVRSLIAGRSGVTESTKREREKWLWFVESFYFVFLHIIDLCRYSHFRTIERNISNWIVSTKDVGMVSWAMPMDRCGVRSLTDSGFLDHPRFQTIVRNNKASRFKIGEGTSAVGRGIINEGQYQGGTKVDAKFKNLRWLLVCTGWSWECG